MTRFYSNENFPMELVNQLRQLGYDVLTSYDAGQANQAIKDEKVLAFAHEILRQGLPDLRNCSMFFDTCQIVPKLSQHLAGTFPKSLI